MEVRHVTPDEHDMLMRALYRSAKVIRPADPETLRLAKEVADRIARSPPPTEAEIIAGGVAFVMGDGS